MRRKGKEEDDYVACRGMARITPATNVKFPGHEVPVAPPDPDLSEYQKGTLYASKSGSLGFRPDDDPEAMYIRRGSSTSLTRRIGFGRQVNRDVSDDVTLYDALVDENDPRAQRLSSWLDRME